MEKGEIVFPFFSCKKRSKRTSLLRHIGIWRSREVFFCFSSKKVGRIYTPYLYVNSSEVKNDQRFNRKFLYRKVLLHTFLSRKVCSFLVLSLLSQKEQEMKIKNNNSQNAQFNHNIYVQYAKNNTIYWKSCICNTIKSVLVI